MAAKRPVSARWLLHEPRAEGALDGVLLVLWHGAGGDIDQPHLISLADAIAAKGGHAARARFDYRVAGKRAPDRMPALIESARRTIEEVTAEVAVRRLFLGGRSMGGRAASMLAAEGDRCDGLVFLSYPLHPAKQKQKLRDEHLYPLKTPMLFLTGDRDELADFDLLQEVVGKLRAATLEVWRGADHSFRKVDPADVDAKVIRWISARTRRARG